MKKVLIVGATGYLGKYLILEAKKQGYWVRALARSPHKLDDLQESIDDMFIAEATNPDTLQGVCDDIDIVISSLGVGSSRTDEKISVRDVDYGGNKNVLDIACFASVKKYIYVSFIINTEVEHLEIARIKKMFEDELKNSGLDYCVIRPTAFFIDMMEFFRMAKKGTVYLMGHGNYRGNAIHGIDLAKVCVDAASSGEKEILVGGPEEHTYREAAEIAFRILGKEPKIKSIPSWPLKIIVKLLRPFLSERRYTGLQFLIHAIQSDSLAPKYGTHTLEEYFKQISEAT